MGKCSVQTMFTCYKILELLNFNLAISRSVWVYVNINFMFTLATCSGFFAPEQNGVFRGFRCSRKAGGEEGGLPQSEVYFHNVFRKVLNRNNTNKYQF